MQKLEKYDYNFRAYDFISHKFLGKFRWIQITAKEFNNRLKEIYSGPFFESRIMLDWI